MSPPTTIADNGPNNHATPTIVQPGRNRIQALRKQAKSLLYHRPVQCYIRLAKMVRDQLKRRVDEGNGVDEDDKGRLG